MNYINRIINSKYNIAKIDITSKNQINKVYNILNKIIKKKINYNSINDLKKLNLLDIEKINNEVRGKYQKQVLEIFKNDIIKVLKSLYCEKRYSLRIGVQAKYKWDLKKLQSIRKPGYDKMGNWRESLKLPNSCFDTRPHQDLSNNGFRSSSILIFFIQISKRTIKSSMLEVARFKSKKILEDTKNYDGYANELSRSVCKNKKWIVPNFLKPGKILLMDSLTCHRSGKKASIPRIALNVKFQPTNLLYIYKSYKIKKSFDLRMSPQTKLLLLANDLKAATKINNALNFELAVVYFFLRKFNLSRKILQKLFKKKINFRLYKKYLAGAIFKKTLNSVTDLDTKLIFYKKIKFKKFSCADSIFNTIN